MCRTISILYVRISEDLTLVWIVHPRSLAWLIKEFPADTT